MKATITSILALAGAATVIAQDFPNNMPACGVSSDCLSQILCGFLSMVSRAHKTR